MKTLVLMTTLAMLFACGDKQEASAPKDEKQQPDSSMDGVMASAPLGKGMAVADARAKKMGDDVLIVGRINKIVPGLGAFNLTDLALEYCGEKIKEDNCKTPWDYCCISSEDQITNRIFVGVYDDAGEILRTQTLGNLRLLDVVTVRGKLETDENGNTTLRATAIYRDARPELADDLRWPE